MTIGYSFAARCLFGVVFRESEARQVTVQSQLSNLSRIKRTVNTDTKGTEPRVHFTEVFVL